ncbi:winged helix-turn-helix domain-containing protein [Pseudoalteromonas sp. A757]|uniref:winged helix-turn-helix domain-containing protein n=1 Tax=Pseudoalteromonas sp. A757 TaxID=2250709 RepID=UPI001EFFB7AB|nr:winged helix-turn-helix domain-containing protein [Pseudoalteromonas sp. A757]
MYLLLVGKMRQGTTYKLLEVNVDTIGHLLSSGRQTCCVQPKFIEVLTVLARAYPRVVTREEIIEQVWDGNLFVGEKALTNAIWHLRKTFKTLLAISEEEREASELEIIETIRKSGYRLKVAPTFTNARINSDPHDMQRPSLKAKIMAVVTILLFVLFAFFYFFVGQSALKPTPQLEEVTDYPGRELFPSVSPNEQFLVFAWRKLGSHSGLYLKHLAQPELPIKELTNGPGNASVSVWSRDNRTLFYIEKRAGQCEIKSLDVITKVQSYIANCVSDTTTTLTYSVRNNVLGFIADKDQTGEARVTLLNLNDRTSTELGCEIDCEGSELESVEFAPNAAQIAITRNLPNGLENLYLKDLETGKEIKILNGLDDLRGISWHPSGDYLVISSIEHGTRSAYKISPEGKTLGILPFDGLSYPSFSRSGRLYFHDWNIKTSIMKLDLNAQVASSPFPLLQSPVSFRYPNYSPFSERIVFVSNQSGFDEIWTSSLTGDKREQMTTLSLQALHPIWSPDGTKIIFLTKSQQGSQLQLLDVNSKQVTQIDTGLEYHGKPSWSSDGSGVYVSDGRDLYHLPLSSESAPVKLTKGDVAYEQEGLLYVYRGELQEMWYMDLATGVETLLFKNAHLASSASWSVSHSGIYYLYVWRGDFRISYFDFASKVHKDIIRVPERSFSRSRGLAFIAEKQWLLFTGYETPQVDIKQVEM